MKALDSMSLKNKRLLRLSAVFALMDLAKGRKPLKTAVKLAAAHGKSGLRTLEKNSKEKEEDNLLYYAVARASKAKDPKEIKRRKMKKKILHTILHKLA